LPPIPGTPLPQSTCKMVFVAKSDQEIIVVTMQESGRCRTVREFWSKHREASLNWLALGMLLAAWNGVDNDAKAVAPPANLAKGHKTVNVL